MEEDATTTASTALVVDHPSREPSLNVPEEPSEDEEEDEDVDDDGDEAEEELSELGAAKVLSDHRPPRGGRTTPITFFTAVGIARWMARAYGYVSKKKALYKSQDKLHQQTLQMDSVRYLKDLTVRSPLFVRKPVSDGSQRRKSLVSDSGGGSGEGRSRSRCNSGKSDSILLVPDDEGGIGGDGGGQRRKRLTAAAPADPRTHRSRSSFELKRIFSRASRCSLFRPASPLPPGKVVVREKDQEEDDDKAGGVSATEGVLMGIEQYDQELICQWWTQSYSGDEDEDYYRAYSRELIRQSRQYFWTEQQLEPLAAWM